MSRTGRFATVLGAVLVMGGIATGLGGCNKVQKGEYDSVLGENKELRDKLAMEAQARQEAETRGASVEQENRDLSSQFDKSRVGKAGNTGFTDAEGMTSYRRGSDVVVDIAGDVLFDSGKATLRASAKKTLDDVCHVIKTKYSGQTIRVEGYSDNDPIKKSAWKSNERLSGERAMAVEEYLVSKGCPNDRVYYAGFGAAHPKASKKESRRVEIVILGSN
jgi:chemotaxis protein MotB